MMNRTLVLKALADETRMTMVSLLLGHRYCVRALARKLKLSEATISQHLKVLREADLVIGERRGYFVHYEVKRDILHQLAQDLEALAATQATDASSEGLGSGAHESCSYRCHQPVVLV